MRFSTWSFMVGAAVLIALPAPGVARSPTKAEQAAALRAAEPPSPPPALRPLGLADLQSTVAASAATERSLDTSRGAVFRVGDRSSLSDNPGAQPGSFSSNLPDRTPETTRSFEGFTALGGGNFTVVQDGR